MGVSAALALLAVAACTDPVVAMRLELPASAPGFDTSCIASVDVFADGKTYPQDTTDYKHACIDLKMVGPTFTDVQTALRDQVTLPIPDTGLSDVEVLAHAGTCESFPIAGDSSTPDIIFSAGAKYTGDDIVLPMVPNVSCATSAAKVRPVDLLQLATTHMCSMSAVADVGAGVSLGTMAADPLSGSVYFGGGFDGGNLSGGVATIPGARVQVSPGVCLAAFGGNDSLIALSCLPTTRAVCAQAGELEEPLINGNTAFMSIDTPVQNQSGPPTFGVVWSGSGDAGAAVAGATVTLDDPTAGVVEFLDVPAGAVTGAVGMTKLPAQATSASGMFVVYSHGMAALTVSQGGRTKHLTVGSVIGDPGATIVSLD